MPRTNKRVYPVSGPWTQKLMGKLELQHRLWYWPDSRRMIRLLLVLRAPPVGSVAWTDAGSDEILVVSVVFETRLGWRHMPAAEPAAWTESWLTLGIWSLDYVDR